MTAMWRAVVFGKPGCPKCGVLRRRLESLLAETGWDDFEPAYIDVETEDGLVAFCRAECINPNRLPALLIMERAPGLDSWRPVERPAPPAPEERGGSLRLYVYFGLQTDYSEAGRGVIPPEVIRSELEAVRRLRASAEG